jgi:ferredoxin
MDMAAQFHEQRLFFSTSRMQGEGVDPIGALALRPALLARYRDLTQLRYDYPLVLVTSGPQAGVVRSLSGIVDDLLLEVAPRGIEGERLRKHVLRLEREIRRLVAAGRSGTLLGVWAEAAARVGSPGDPSVEGVLSAIGEKLNLDGEVVDCNAAGIPRVLTHFWQAEHSRKGRAFRATSERLIVKLSDILRAAFIHSKAGQRPDALRASLGGADRDDFDFDVMSKLVSRRAPKDELSPSRRKRIEWALAMLKGQPFYPDPRRVDRPDAPATYEFAFDNCVAAAEAFRARLPELALVVKAFAVAELEADGRYVEAKDDPFFEHFDESALSADDLALFPDYLVCIPPERNDAPENAILMEMLSSGLPVKVLVETSDLYEEAAIGAGHFAFGVRSVRLANTATGLGGVYVVQTTSANLPALRERIKKGFAHRGAALFSIYAGAPAPAGELPSYLTAAAALEARAFPAFAYDPYAGDNQAARFILADNPQADADWPTMTLEYADENQQRVAEPVAFSYIDFVLCDRRYARHFARVPRERWNASMIPAADWMARDPKTLGDLVPYVFAVDADDVLQRVIVDQRLMHAAVRCRTLWHRLQEQGGIHNSHAERLLARARAAWEAQRQREAAEHAAEGAVAVKAPAAAAATAAPAPGEAAAAEAPAHSPDEAWIETSRCPSCNECQLINDKLFVYNENKQAYITDVKLGTYRQLVEAAESCQVSIIHPGKPWNPKEPGLPELLERAKPFL